MEFSRLLIDKIKSIKDNNIADIILSNYDNLYDMKFDYINVGSRHDLISFLPEDKQDKASEYGDEWSNYRNEVKVGRFVKQILKEVKEKIDSKISYKDKDIEEFVNKFKVASSNENFEFIIVNGLKIKNWYLEDNYTEEGSGSLMDSCMKDSYKQDYLNLYSRNKSIIQLVCLLDKNTNLLMGRALLWTLDESPSPTNLFLDRIYVAEEYLYELFKQKAEEEGWMYKCSQSNDIEKGQEFVHLSKKYKGLIKVKLKRWRFDYYPYVDSMTFFDPEKGVLQNRGFRKANFLRSVDGYGSEQCDECYGKWEYECDDCDIPTPRNITVEDGSNINSVLNLNTVTVSTSNCSCCNDTGIIKCNTCNFG